MLQQKTLLKTYFCTCVFGFVKNKTWDNPLQILDMLLLLRVPCTPFQHVEKRKSWCAKNDLVIAVQGRGLPNVQFLKSAIAGLSISTEHRERKNLDNEGGQSVGETIQRLCDFKGNHSQVKAKALLLLKKVVQDVLSNKVRV